MTQPLIMTTETSIILRVKCFGNSLPDTINISLIRWFWLRRKFCFRGGFHKWDAGPKDCSKDVKPGALLHLPIENLWIFISMHAMTNGLRSHTFWGFVPIAPMWRGRSSNRNNIDRERRRIGTLKPCAHLITAFWCWAVRLFLPKGKDCPGVNSNGGVRSFLEI